MLAVLDFRVPPSCIAVTAQECSLRFLHKPIHISTLFVQSKADFQAFKSKQFTFVPHCIQGCDGVFALTFKPIGNVHCHPFLSMFIDFIIDLICWDRLIYDCILSLALISTGKKSHHSLNLLSSVWLLKTLYTLPNVCFAVEIPDNCSISSSHMKRSMSAHTCLLRLDKALYSTVPTNGGVRSPITSLTSQCVGTRLAFCFYMWKLDSVNLSLLTAPDPPNLSAPILSMTYRSIDWM